MEPDQLTRPAHLWIPPRYSSAGAEMIDLASSIGYDLDPEQKLALDAMGSEREDGKWAAFEVALIACRQNLKTLCLELSALNDIFVRDVKLVTWTAHLFSTAEESFRNLSSLVLNNDHLARQLKGGSKGIRSGSGSQAIELTGGRRIIFKARTGATGRGFTGETVIMDEALYLRADMMGAYMPTLSAKSKHGNVQIRYGSSAGVPESDVLRRLRDRGRAGNDPSLIYLEWMSEPGRCADEVCDHSVGTAGCQLDDPEAWREGNPALDRRIAREFVAAERATMTPTEFARERLGWWDDPLDVTDLAISAESWGQGFDPDSQADDPIAFAIDVTPLRTHAAIGAFGRRDDGLGHVECVDSRPGVGWLMDRIEDLYNRWNPSAIALDETSGAGSLIPEFEARGIPFLKVGARAMGQACGAFFDDVEGQRIKHVGQEPLNIAVNGAKRRPIGDLWAFGRKSSAVNISPLVACTLAHWAWHQMPTPKKVSGFVDVGWDDEK